MNDVKLYIGGVRCDMYQDEDITLTKQITDYEDPDKVLSNFTQSFTIPASPTNNGIFQHYYNLDVDGTFDPFAKVDAYLESNSLPIDNGIIELISVNTKKHRPESYNIVFYGLITGLKTLFQDDTLEVLDVSGLDHAINYANITDSWDLNLLSGNVVYPLVDFERPWIYSSTVNDARDITSSGILASELKPAIRLKYIWDKIFTHYGLTYTSDIIDASGTFNGLYMLMHREAGDLNDEENVNDNFTSININSANIIGTGVFQMDFLSIISDINGNASIVNNDYTAPISGNYTFKFSRTNISGSGPALELGYKVNGAGLTTIHPNLTGGGSTNFSIYLTAGDVVTLWWTIAGNVIVTGGVFSTHVYPRYAYNNTINVGNLWPKEFKIRDFIDGILKMYDLIIVPDGINNFIIENRQDYYQNGERKDWNRYIDLDNVTYSKVPIFNQISFEHSEGKDMPQQILNNVLGRKYGSASFEPDLLFASNSLDVSTPFAPTVLVEMLDQDASGTVIGNTGIYINRMLDKDEKPVVDKPRIFYYDDNLKNTCSAYKIQSGTSSGLPTYTVTSEAPVCGMFTDFVCDADTESFNFSIETPLAGIPPIKTLFQQYYSDYIQRLYDLQARVVKVKAVIPLAEYIKIELSDNIEFDGHYYVINKISYNLSTNMATLDLISFFREKTYPSVASSSWGGDVDLDATNLVAKKEKLYNITKDDNWRTFAFQTAMEAAQRGQPTLLPMEGYTDSNVIIT